MKFLTDENIATSVVRELRQNGLDVKDIKEQKLHGVADQEILAIAYAENRIIITHDKDFANVLLSPKIKHKGIILIRLKSQRPENVAKIITKLLNSDILIKLANNLTIVTETQITIHHQDKN